MMPYVSYKLLAIDIAGALLFGLLAFVFILYDRQLFACGSTLGAFCFAYSFTVQILARHGVILERGGAWWIALLILALLSAAMIVAGAIGELSA